MNAELTLRPASRNDRRWALALVVALAPLWLIGIFHRGLWTPDEPREADIAWRMTQQSNRTLPELAGTPFLEKPPLSYWMSAAAIDVFGDSPQAARAPDLLYAVVTGLALGALAYIMGGASAAFLSAIFAATALIVFRVEVWLAPDAGLLCGCALALLGAYLGFTASPGRRKLIGYTLMHAGAAIGFMFKSAPGWLAPGLALLATIAWERKWSELTRWELYAGVLLQIAVIAPWIYAVLQSPDGHDTLLAFFWHNVVGRFTKLAGPSALDYTTGHKNWFGKYFFELPVYLFPWTLIALAALVRAWRMARVPGQAGRPWRFAVAAVLPFLLVLSAAATARDIYAAPALLGISLLMALWATQARESLRRFDQFALRGTQVLVGCITCVFVGALIILGAERNGDLGSAEAVSGVVLFAAAVIVPAIAAVALWLSVAAQRRGDVQRCLHWIYAAYAGALCLAALAAFPAVDRWQNLPDIARDISRDAGGATLGLLNPDETTIAMLDHSLRTPFVILATSPTVPTERVVTQFFSARGARARVLVDLPGHAPGEFSDFVGQWRPRPPPGDGDAGRLLAERSAILVRRYQLPQGRRYALLGPP